MYADCFAEELFVAPVRKEEKKKVVLVLKVEISELYEKNLLYIEILLIFWGGGLCDKKYAFFLKKKSLSGNKENEK